MHDMVVFGEDWGRHPSSTQHLVRHLATDRAILWVNSIGLRRPRLNRRDLRRVFQKARSLTRKQDKLSGNQPSGFTPTNLNVLAPIAIPWPGNPMANAVNKVALKRQLRHAMKRKNISKPLLWCSLPTAELACDTLDERAVIYYCGDDFGAWQGVDHKPVLEAEKRLVERADLVIASSDHLIEKFPREKTILIEHGVDHEIFASPAPRPHDLPGDRPVAGFFGSIGDRIDVDAIADAARQMPDWYFMLIGPIQTDCNRLIACSNAIFLGNRDHHKLAGYVQNWDVSLLPFRKGADMDASNPLKLREYFAAGTPIAATCFKALKRYQQLVCMASDATDLPNAIRAALHDKKHNHLRRKFVAGESWVARAAKIESVIATL